MTRQSPPEGIDLDAALDQVRARTLRAIDRRHHRRMPIIVGAIAAGALVTGTAAAALVVSHPWTVQPSTRTLYQLYCQQGNGINGADGSSYLDPYYSISFYVQKSAGTGVDIDPISVCRRVWVSTMTKWATTSTPNHSGSAGVAFISPRKLITDRSITPVKGGAGAIFSPGDYDGVVPPMAVCVRPDEKGAAVYVISAEPGETKLTKRQWRVRCEINDGFVYQPPSG
jgi:hypothetical protein